MADKIRRRKNITFVGISFFFLLSMFFLFWNISSRMYNNANILFCIKEAKSLQNIILSSIDFDSKNPEIENNLKTLINIVKGTNFYPPVFSVKIYSNEKKLLYNLGREVNLKEKKTIDDLVTRDILYNKTVLIQENIEAYQVIFPLAKNGKNLGYGEVLYDLTFIDITFFKEKRLIYIVVFSISFFIVLFLMIMVINLQKRVSLLEKEVQEVSTTDITTGLFNKDHFSNLMKKEIERIERTGGKLSLLSSDIDNFMEINENYGYEFGDLILKTVANIFISNFRNFDIIGRFGGDEILILMVDSSEEEGFVAAEKCRLNVQENKFYYEGKEITITVSFGISSTEEFITEKRSFSKNNYRNLIFDSLNGLARAKREGKNKTIKHSQM
ncbi:MAG: hypothetical protein A2086_08080 [Spirochaetes bacterium GWD1_27_9]|nr:MAG: hypothetical protein A2Z98_13940 [Spirochaetes bacterium GWB1_27_13]OHD28147.1 MAG: hypothetical protein A2Y34_11305 [Spirochaetes bacterium GWC1_27_15]OHD34478.1 MAG: hypothetical protein A2086_08080 [Spirochaetes bacterium GWD1_27_9]